MRRGAEQTQASAHIARAGADLERPVRASCAQSLQDSPLNFGGEHGLTESDWNRRIGERKVAIPVRHEGVARYRVQHLEHSRVENFPSANLLINHLLPSGQSIHNLPIR